MADALADRLEASRFLDGCPVATVALEAASQSPPLQRACSASYARWQAVIEQRLPRWGVPPEQLKDLLALMGDSSDNIPGIPGVGPKKAAGLIQEYGSLEAVLAHAGEVKGKKLQESLTEQEREMRL